jgi:chitin synthase
MHDVLWGRKGDNKVFTDLGVVSAGKGCLWLRQISMQPMRMLYMFYHRKHQKFSKPNPATQQEDYNKTLRTNVTADIVIT